MHLNKKKFKIGIILGTRPEIIKMSPVIRECVDKKINFFILHTNQHYSENLDRIFFKELKLPHPKYNIGSRSGTHAEELSRMIIGIEKVLFFERPEFILVLGDTNTVLAGTLVASKLGIRIGHIEAGLRSYDRNMPEEINRVLTDHSSDLLFVPTKAAGKNLEKEGVPKNKIFITGSTIVDSVFQNLKISKKRSGIVKDISLESQQFILFTAHRPENVDSKENLKKILSGIELVADNFKLPIIFPMHPRTEKMIKKFELKVPKNIKTIHPVGYLDFLQLESNAKIIFTDSGGVQEEACILKVPCVTLRENTERPETLEIRSNVLAGTDPLNILKKAIKMANIKRNWENPFGEKESSKRIIDLLLKQSA
ncbi:MAG: UDP-N-acetylglucosamine 2-epimerase (non-hydrolyzing) [Patescibacteria group bacterium]